MQQADPTDVIFLMGPQGAGKSTLGNELDRVGVASYTELEPKLVTMFGEGEAFTQRRPEALRWIHDFYRDRAATASLPVVMETTGISGRAFITELAGRYAALFVKLDTLRELCIQRVATRPKGRNINTATDGAGAFFDYWYAEIEPTYEFDLCVSGTHLHSAVRVLRKAVG